MAIKNFQNRLKENGPNLTKLKDPALAEDFNLVDFDDRKPNNEVGTSNPQNGTSFELEKSIALPLDPTQFTSNLEITQRQPRENTEITERKSRDNLEITQRQPRDNLEKIESPLKSAQIDSSELHPDFKAAKPRDNLEITQRQLRDNLEKIEIKPRDNTEKNLSQPTETWRKLRDEPRDDSRDNLENTQREPRDNSTFSSLVGLQRKITLYLYEETKRVRARITDEISSRHLAELFQTTIINAQNCIKELIKKGIIRRAEFKVGRGGWTRYEISNDLYQQLNLYEATGKLRDNLEKTSLKPRDKLRDEPRDNLSSSSDLILNESKTTTSEINTPDRKELPPDWKEIDYSCLASIGFKPHHIDQIYNSNKTTPEMVQESIFELDHDLRSGEKHGMRSPLLVLLSQLRGKGEPYTTVIPGYESDALKYERKRLEELKRRKLELDQIRNQQDELLEEFKTKSTQSDFEDWLATKNQTQVKQLTRGLNPTLPSGQAMLKQAYQEERRQVQAHLDQAIGPIDN